MTAEELMAQLNADPQFRARREAQEARFAERRRILAADEQQLVGEIRDRGYDIDSVWDLVNNTPHSILERRCVGAYEGAYGVLIKHLRLPHHPAIREGIVRSLTVKDGGREVEDALFREFQEERDANLRWVLASALRTAMPYHRRRRHPEVAAAFSQPPEAEQIAAGDVRPGTVPE